MDALKSVGFVFKGGKVEQVKPEPANGSPGVKEVGEGVSPSDPEKARVLEFRPLPSI